MKWETTGIRLALALSAASGLIYEVVATHILLFYFIRSTYSISTVLSVFLFGLGVGSFLVYRFENRIKDKRLLFGVVQLVLGFYCLLVLANLTRIIPPIHTLGLFASSFLILLPPTLCLGAAFPLAGSIIRKRGEDVIGLVYSVDLAGAVLGALIAGFFLIPILGNIATILFAVILNFLAVLIMLRGWSRALALMGIAIVMLSVFGAPVLGRIAFQNEGQISLSEPSDQPEYESPEPESKPEEPPEPESKERFSKSSPFGEVVVEDHILFIDNRLQCSLDYGPYSTAGTIVSYALDPLNSRDLEVLNIGLGCGITLESILDKLDTTVDVVEINPVVVEANNLMFHSLDNERVNLIIDDGLNYLRQTDKRYDSIIMDIENPAVIHSSDLYTLEAFDIISGALNERGTFGLWVYECLNQRYYDIIYNTLNGAFPHVYKINNFIFVASKQELSYQEYYPKYKQVNTLDRKELSRIYFEECRWWRDDQNILKDL